MGGLLTHDAEQYTFSALELKEILAVELKLVEETLEAKFKKLDELPLESIAETHCLEAEIVRLGSFRAALQTISTNILISAGKNKIDNALIVIATIPDEKRKVNIGVMESLQEEVVKLQRLIECKLKEYELIPLEDVAQENIREHEINQHVMRLNSIQSSITSSMHTIGSIDIKSALSVRMNISIIKPKEATLS